MDSDGPESLLPWRLPFRMVDRLLACEPHRRIDTLKRVTAGDAMGSARNERNQVLPEAMVLEGMGQSASLLHQMTYGKLAPTSLPMLGFVKAKHLSPARPGDTVEFTVRAVKMTPTMGLFEASARVDGAQIAEAEFALGVSGESEPGTPPHATGTAGRTHKDPDAGEPIE